MYKNDLIDRSI